jgi:hypothetical protein
MMKITNKKCVSKSEWWFTYPEVPKMKEGLLERALEMGKGCWRREKANPRRAREKTKKRMKNQSRR